MGGAVEPLPTGTKYRKKNYTFCHKAIDVGKILLDNSLLVTVRWWSNERGIHIPPPAQHPGGPPGCPPLFPVARIQIHDHVGTPCGEIRKSSFLQVRRLAGAPLRAAIALGITHGTFARVMGRLGRRRGRAFVHSGSLADGGARAAAGDAARHSGRPAESFQPLRCRPQGRFPERFEANAPEHADSNNVTGPDDG
jgi:hypothetical protein